MVGKHRGDVTKKTHQALEIMSDNVFGRRSWSANMTSTAFGFFLLEMVGMA